MKYLFDNIATIGTMATLIQTAQANNVAIQDIAARAFIYQTDAPLWATLTALTDAEAAMLDTIAYQRYQVIFAGSQVAL